MSNQFPCSRTLYIHTPYPPMAEAAGELPMKRPREEMEANNECMSYVILGWFSEISPMWPGDFVTFLFVNASESAFVQLWFVIGVTLIFCTRFYEFWGILIHTLLLNWTILDVISAQQYIIPFATTNSVKQCFFKFNTTWFNNCIASAYAPIFTHKVYATEALVISSLS